MPAISGVIFVHGIVGNNRIFDFMTALVPVGYEVRFVELKGHGGDALGFSKASMAQWKAQVDEAVNDMSERCDKIFGVGHSMGCLLLMEPAARGLLAGLFLMNPPMRVRPRLSMLTNALKVASGHFSTDQTALAAKEAYGISIDFNPLHYYGWPKRFTELFMEIRRVRRSVMEHIKCPVVAFLSARDEMVALSSAEIIAKLPDATTIVLSGSTHYHYSEADRREICREFLKML